MGFGGAGLSSMGVGDYGFPYPKKGKIQKSWFVKAKVTPGFGKQKKPTGSKKLNGPPGKKAVKNNWSKGPNLRYKNIFPNAGY